LSYLGIVEDTDTAKVHYNPNQLRRKIENIEELSESIRKHGLLQPIVVRPREHGFEVVAGNRRLAAVKMLRMRKVACHIIELSDKEAYEVAIVENVQHKTMNPIEEAIAFKKYVERHGWGGVTELANRIGKSQEFVSKRIQLLRLPERIQQEIIRQRITTSAGLEMLPLEKNNMEEVADILLSKQQLTRDDIRNIIKMSRNSEEYSEKTVTEYTQEIYFIDKALRKSIAVMKSTLVNFDDIINNIGDDWVIRELLMQYRMIIHGDIDTFLKLRKRLNAKVPRGYFMLQSDHRHRKAGHESKTNNTINSIHLWSTKGVWQ
jgi:ParB family chromosome partitioning protein